VTTLLTADDLFLFNQGTHYRLYDKLGAHVVEGGTYFAVWAPNARAVGVIGDWNGWRSGASPLSPRESSGIWEGVVAGIGHGARYKFAIEGADGAVHEKADPFAARAEHPPATASIVWQARYEWGDAAWLAGRGARIDRRAPISIYELHAGSWRRDRHEVLGYRELGERLGDHVGNLGFTHVELMPLSEHPFYGSWGYQVTGYFAATTRYGAPEDLMAMIDGLHRRGIGVILDWVPAHFPTDGHGLGRFDGTHLFEHADPRRGFHPDWTSYIFNFARHEVKAFLISSAIAWLDRFHVDGLRVDGVASMLYRDYSRKAGEWVPDDDGSNHDRAAIRLLQDFNTAVATSYPDVATFAEESTSWDGVTRAADRGGLGFGYKWDLGWMHDTLTYFARDPIHRKYHHHELTFRGMYATSEAFVLSLSHDEVVHGKGSLLNKLAGDPWQKHATLRLLYGYQWTLPGKKLVFMGGELGVWNEWNHDLQLDWAIAEHPSHAGLLRWLADLNRAYRELPALHYGDCDAAGFRWMDPDDRDAGVLSYARWGRAEDPPVVVVANLTPVPREGYRVPVPRLGRWREALNSDAQAYGGSGLGNYGGVTAEPVPARYEAQSIAVTAPPLGVLILVAEEG
jgi:1,4-alpha-glucan branching enzyme